MALTGVSSVTSQLHRLSILTNFKLLSYSVGGFIKLESTIKSLGKSLFGSNQEILDICRFFTSIGLDQDSTFFHI
jgi:hypothetical protein